ncbi:antitoxin [Streptomyces sp. Tue 6430]|nr:antitoxin [Streptomyces sp. Tue 6430]
MGLLHNLKARLSPAKDKVSGLAHQHGDRIHHGIDKAAHVVDEKTKGKYSGKIQSGTGKAKGAVDRLAHKDEPGRAATRSRPQHASTDTPADVLNDGRQRHGENGRTRRRMDAQADGRSRSTRASACAHPAVRRSPDVGAGRGRGYDQAATTYPTPYGASS